MGIRRLNKAADKLDRLPTRDVRRLPADTRDALGSFLLAPGDRLRATSQIATACCEAGIAPGTEFTLVRERDGVLVIRVGDYYLPSEAINGKVTDYHNITRGALDNNFEMLSVEVGPPSNSSRPEV